jgi:hypothetical protein
VWQQLQHMWRLWVHCSQLFETPSILVVLSSATAWGLHRCFQQERHF